MIQAAQLLLALGILVIIHEFGHYLPAKYFKTKVERFFLFFDWPFAVFKKKIGETTWGIGILPLGGYCKIAGMIDESMDKKSLENPPEKWEFRSKPAWQRLIIMIGGVCFNVILAFIIYTCLFKINGTTTLNQDSIKYGFVFSETCKNMGFQDGDKIISLDKTPVSNHTNILLTILLDEIATVEIERDGSKKEIKITESDRTSLLKMDRKGPSPIAIASPAIINSFLENSAAENGGLKKGDEIIFINNKNISFNSDVSFFIKPFESQNISCSVIRLDDTLNFNFTTSAIEYPMGVSWDLSFLEYNNETHSIFKSASLGVKKTFTVLGEYTKQFKLIGKAPGSVGGFITIGQIFPKKWNWTQFWTMTAFLSIILAVINILPIPALDGGHVVFLCYEIITGKKTSKKVLEYAQIVGMIILLAIVIFANGNDIIRLFK